MNRIVMILIIMGLIITGCSRMPAVEVEQTPPAGQEEEVGPLPLTLVAVGDIMLSRGVAGKIRDNSAHFPFEATKHITSKGDITFGNLETTIAATGTQLPGKGIWFRAVPHATEGLKDAGFDILSLANNHILDYDTPALIETMDNLERAGIGYVGAGENLEQARRPLIIVKNGVRVGFLAYHEFYHYFWSYSYRRSFEATEDTAGTTPMKEELIKEDIAKLKDLCDVVVVSLHWGIEDSNRVTRAQQQLAYKIVDWGADIILGHHPHVLQGIEFYNDSLIVYSLGNFVFDQNRENNNQSIILEIALEDNEIVRVAALPIYIYGNYQPGIPDDARKEYILNKIAQLSEALGTSVLKEEERVIFGEI